MCGVSGGVAFDGASMYSPLVRRSQLLDGVAVHVEQVEQPLDAVACVARELRDAKSRGDDILTTLDNLKPKRAR